MDHRQGAGANRRTGLRSRLTVAALVAALGRVVYPVLRGSGRRRLLTVLATMFLLGACGGRDPAPFVAELDGLALPSTWQVAQTDVRSQGGATGCVELVDPECPRITRYYLVTGELVDVLAEAKRAAVEAGFGGIEVRHPACDSPLSGPRCSFDASKEGMVLRVNIHPPGANVDGLGLANADLATVRMALSRN